MSWKELYLPNMKGSIVTGATFGEGLNVPIAEEGFQYQVQDNGRIKKIKHRGHEQWLKERDNRKN